MKQKKEFRLRPLGELCEVTGGSSAPQGEEFFRGGTIPFVRMRDLGAYHHTTQLDTTRDLVTPEAVEKKRLKIFEPGCILFPRSGSVQLNHRAILAIRAAIVSHIGILQKFTDEIDVRYFYWFFVSYDMGEIAKQTTGLDLVNFSDVKKISVPVPPTLDDQRKIVCEIEKQFTRLEAGGAALRRVQANLKRYRAAVLKAACEGKFVPTEAELATERTENTEKRKRPASVSSVNSVAKNPGFETGAELLQRILAERRKNWTGRGKYKEPAAPDTAKLPPLPEGWTWTSGAQLFTWASGEGLTQKDIQPGEFPVYGGNGVTGYHNAFVAENPTIVIGRVGALCGNVYLTNGRAWITDNAIYATQTPSDASMKFVEIVFSQAGLNKKAAGSGQPFVNQRMLNETVVPLPPLAEQTRIVAEVERRLSVVEELESVVSANLQCATRLRQSILQKAFTGRF